MVGVAAIDLRVVPFSMVKSEATSGLWGVRVAEVWRYLAFLRALDGSPG
jgi:hypothetical protein